MKSSKVKIASFERGKTNAVTAPVISIIIDHTRKCTRIDEKRRFRRINGKSLQKIERSWRTLMFSANCIFRQTWLELLYVNTIKYITVERVKCDG